MKTRKSYGGDRSHRQVAKERFDNMKNKIEYIFPILLIILDLAAAAVYASQKDWKKTIYWISAAVLNAAVTF